MFGIYLKGYLYLYCKQMSFFKIRNCKNAIIANLATCTCIITYLPTPGKTLQHKRGWLGLLVDFLSLIKKKDIVTINKICNYILLWSPSLGKIIHVHVHKTFKMNFKFESFIKKKQTNTIKGKTLRLY